MPKWTRACYSKRYIFELRDMMKAVKWKVDRKAQHTAKVWEVKKIYDYAADHINCMYESDYGHIKEYIDMVYYNYGGTTKREMDTKLKWCGMSLANEMNEILTMIENGEVDCVEYGGDPKNTCGFKPYGED